MIPVAKPYLPSKEKYQSYVDQIYASGWLTNNGPMVQKLEERLSKYLGVKHVICVANGSLALQVAYKAMNLKGEVITTPFSFVATASTLVWEGLKPIFADINPYTYNLDPQNIEKLITKETSAIVPVHVFGNACEVEEIEQIAKKHDLKVIYDAAHAFNVKYKDESVLNYGDISTLSFHATKLFHTIEGGALIINDATLAEKARYLINFGIENAESVPHLGTNAKMNEFEAAMGLCVLDDIEAIKESRKFITEHYQKELKDIVVFQEQNLNATENYSYFPVAFKDESELLKVQKALNEADTNPRRYFYPSLDTLNYIKPKQECEISRDISKRILCLPLYWKLEYEDMDSIIETMKGVL